MRPAHRWDEARSHVESAAGLYPNDAGVATVQAVVAIELGAEPPMPRAHLRRAVALAPADANARVNLAVFGSAEGRLNEAL